MQRKHTYHLMVVVWYTRFLKKCAESSLQNRGKKHSSSNLTNSKLIQYLAIQPLATLQQNLLNTSHIEIHRFTTYVSYMDCYQHYITVRCRCDLQVLFS